MSPARATTDREKLLLVGCFAVVVAYVGVLATMFAKHQWVVDRTGHPLLTDFLEVWVAGGFVQRGMPAAPYDWRLHHVAQVAAMGHDFKGFLGWHYPPLFLFVAAALAALPYTAAFITWVVTTAAACGAVIGRIARRPEAALVTLAMPAALGCATVGQNGFFTTAIIGSALLALEDNPVTAGVFMGLLTYKPQFGLLFPLALLASRNWRALASAAFTTIVLLALCWLAFGTAPFAEFFGYMPETASHILGEGSAGFQKLQSVYGLSRWLGANETVAWCAHGLALIGAAAAIVWLWKRDAPNGLKAAALAVATLIATPYAYMYDFPLLAVPFAFLFRERVLDRIEIAAVIGIIAAMVIFTRVALPIGPLLALVPAILIVRRLIPSRSRAMALQAV
jgi:hypothetical protein